MPSAAKARKIASKKSSRNDVKGSKPSKAASHEPDDRGAPAVPEIRFPPCLTASQRRTVHAAADAFGVPHASEGDGVERRVLLGPSGAAEARPETELPWEEGQGEVSDALLLAVLADALGSTEADVARVASAGASGGRGGDGGAGASGPTGGARVRGLGEAGEARGSESGMAPLGVGLPPAPTAPSHPPMEAEPLVDRLRALLDAELAAEVAASEAEHGGGDGRGGSSSPGHLDKLRASEVEGGLLGRTLVTLQSTRLVPGGGAAALPDHGIAVNDLVRLVRSGGGGGGVTAGGDGAGGGSGGEGGGSARAGPAAAPPPTGVVTKVRDAAVVVALDELPGGDELGGTLRLERLANRATHERLSRALQELLAAARDTSAVSHELVQVLLRRRAPRFTDPPPGPATPPTSSPSARLDDSQRAALTRALLAKDLSLIHGPPGTGKTTALVEIIAAEVARGNRVLVASASNVAVDNLTARLVRRFGEGEARGASASSGGKPKAKARAKPAGGGGGGAGGAAGRERADPRPPTSGPSSLSPSVIVRVGHPARLLPEVLGASLEARVDASDGAGLAREARAEMRQLGRQLVKLGSVSDAAYRKMGTEERRALKEGRRAARVETRKLAADVRRLEGRAVAEVLGRSRVVCTTLTGVGAGVLRDQLQFDLVVIDEAGQATEPACWAALLRGRRAVLAGDHLQLPPTVISEAGGARAGTPGSLPRSLTQTLFERAQASLGGSCSTMLTRQYRMHEDIAGWSSAEFYDGRLRAAPEVAGHTLQDLEGVAQTRLLDPSVRLLFVDTAGCGGGEEAGESGSLSNADEARGVLAHVARLLAAGLAPAHIGVLTPYRAQVRLLRELKVRAIEEALEEAAGEEGKADRAWGVAGLPPGLAASLDALEISTVDAFQGREKEAVVFSTVRSNSSGSVGFLSDSRRANVAVTRARRHLAVFGDGDTLRADPFLSRLVTYLEEKGEYESLQAYL